MMFSPMMSSLLKALQAAGVPLELGQVIIDFHSRLHFCVQGSTARIKAGRGIRQGCPLAPQLWAITSGFILDAVEQRIGRPTALQPLSLYADDHLGSWQIQSKADFARAVTEATALLDVLGGGSLLRAIGQRCSPWQTETSA